MKTNKKDFVNNVTIENAQLIFRNFAGAQTTYNTKGKRNFCVFIDDQAVVEDMISDGWNIKFTKPRDEEDEPRAYLQVTVAYDKYPPTVVAVTSKAKKLLKEDKIGELDWLQIEEASIVIRPYTWEVNGKSGIKAYLKAMKVRIYEDEIFKDIAELPEEDFNFLTDGSLPF